jgi:predicted MFS family arabinose efflux permease
MAAALAGQGARLSVLAPFHYRNFRYQWPADLATSWAYEMETIVLGWYVLVETQSVYWLTAFAAIQYIGTLLSPMFGVMGNRIGNKRLLCGMRGLYTTLAVIMAALTVTGQLTPVYVFVSATLLGLVRPSDQVMRYALIGETMPASHMLPAASVSRTTQDSARIMGALSGAGLVAAFGMGPVYVVIAAFYALSFALTLRVQGVRRAAAEVGQSSPWRDLKEGVLYSWNTPQILAAMWLALLVNLTAFPLTHGLLPYVAKEVLHTSQTGLGYLSAGFAVGAVIGALGLSRVSSLVPPARCMVIFCAGWYVALLIFSHMGGLAPAVAVMVLTGCMQSLGMVSMSALLLRTSSGPLRSRVMGLRMLMIYGLPVGLMAAGPLITRLGYHATVWLYCLTGIVLTTYIAWHWRAHLWRIDAVANHR